MSRHVGSRIEAGRPQHRAWAALSSTKGMIGCAGVGAGCCGPSRTGGDAATGEGQERGENYLGV